MFLSTLLFTSITSVQGNSRPNSVHDTGSGFTGSYSDPNHPNCLRYVYATQTSGQVYGTDAAGGEGVPCNGVTDIRWGPLPATINQNKITVDFSSKGGPSDLQGQYNSTTPAIDWIDGNSWTKLGAKETTRLAKTDTVDELDVNKYVGLWYQTYANIYSTATFEKDGYCITALYGTDTDQGDISVHNYQTIGGPTGPPDTIDGYAYVPDASEPGQLLVHFDNTSAFDAPYWVLELGPVNADNLYDYAIVSDPFGAFLYVLARNVADYYEKYDADVQLTLVKLGFTGINKPIQTYHGEDCVYEDLSDDTNKKDSSSNDDFQSLSKQNMSIMISVAAVVAVGVIAIASILYIRRSNLLSTKENLLKQEERHSELPSV